MLNCPDCGNKLNQIIVERFQTKVFCIDYNKEAIQSDSSSEPWSEANDYAYHCPKCYSPNVDILLKEFDFEE